jgi:hypothetical protein
MKPAPKMSRVVGLVDVDAAVAQATDTSRVRLRAAVTLPRTLLDQAIYGDVMLCRFTQRRERNSWLQAAE